MTENRKKILEMLAENKISADEAYRLLDAVDAVAGAAEGGNNGGGVAVKEKPKYLRVTVLPNADSNEGDRVNVRVPLSMIRAGIKFTSLIPAEARDKVNDALQDKGINFDVHNIRTEDLEELIEALSELEVDVISRRGEKVKVFVE